MENEDKKVKLGFGYIPVPQYIFVGAKPSEVEGPEYFWYSLDFKTNKSIPITDQALTGYVTGMRMINKPYKGKDAVKVDISIQADRKYVIRSGIETIFTRGLLLALEIFDNLKDIPVTICVTPGDEENVIYASVYNAISHEVVKFDWDKSKKLSPVVNKIQEMMGQEVQNINKVLEEGRSNK